MENKLPKRKPNRLEDYDYSQNGSYFVTICSKDKQHIFGEIISDKCNAFELDKCNSLTLGNCSVGAGVLDRPKVVLTQLGESISKAIEFQNTKQGIAIDKYIVMPNHVHIIVAIDNDKHGRSRTPALTISKLIGTMKSYITKKYGDVWQKGFHDHIIRNDEDYNRITEYILDNPRSWEEDKYYV